MTSKIKGQRVKLIASGSPTVEEAIPPGTCGTVRHTDSQGYPHVRWDNGRYLTLLPGYDVWEVINEADLKAAIARHPSNYHRPPLGDVT